MKVVVFCHSLASCWNHGNAHFLRGVVSNMLDRGFEVDVYEPRDAWSVQNLCAERGPEGRRAYQTAYPDLASIEYTPETLDLDEALRGADVVLVHEWNDPELVARIGQHRSEHGGYRLLFHDTHHRGVTAPHEMARYDLSDYDGVLAFGDVLRDLYLRNEWARAAWTWHEAADPKVFRPLDREKTGDLVWVGNWGDEERTEELHEFLLRPVKELGLKATVYGVRYPDHARKALADAGIEYGGWLPNHEAPEVFARHRMTVHVPRRPYTQALPGIPTIRPFEAMASGLPLVCSPWDDREGLFNGDADYLTARDGEEMKRHLRGILDDPETAARRAEHARQTILSRHTCGHRVDELLQVLQGLAVPLSA